MAAERFRFRIHRARAFTTSRQAAYKLVREVTHEVNTGAFVILANGPYTTGQLMMGLGVDINTLALKVVGSVGISGRRFPYAASVEGGAKPHRFGANPPKRYLRFYWRKVGERVTLLSVNHPGQSGKGYLRHPLLRSAIRHNMRLVIYDV